MKNRTNVRWLTQLALLVAILLVLNYTPLGYLQIGPLSASLLTVPVAIGAMTMNPMAGAILGGVFGATSFIQAVEGKSAMGAALFQVSPAGTFVVCFVARVLMGLCTALIFNALRKAMPKNEKLACFLGGLSAPVLNTVFFMGFLVLIFYNCDYVQNLANTLGAQNAFMFIVLLVGVQAIFEWVHLLRRCRCRVAAGTEISEDELKKQSVLPGMGGTLCVFYRAVGAAHVRPGGAQWADVGGKAAGRACPAPTGRQ